MKKRYYDGARTIFCLIVLLSHFTLTFCPNARTRIWNDGNLAVIYFLVLAGGVTALSTQNSKSNLSLKSLFQFGVKRYFRLLPVVFISIIGAFIIFRGGTIITKLLLIC